MSEPQEWRWDTSNGDATAEETFKAYTALTTGGQTKAFTASVWNDIVAKISEQKKAWRGSAWDDSILSIEDSKISTTGTGADRNMTAERFNSAVLNVWPLEEWPWEETLGRKAIHRGDHCIGAYFIYLTEGLNHWILDLTPAYIELGLRTKVNTTVDTLLLSALLLNIELEGAIDASLNTKLDLVLQVLIDLGVKVEEEISVEALKAILLNLLLRVRTIPIVSAKIANAAKARIINFMKTETDLNARCDTVAKTDVINDIDCYLKCTVLTGELSYNSILLDIEATLTADMGCPDALFFELKLCGSHEGFCDSKLLDCTQFAFDLEERLDAKATLDAPRLLKTGIDITSPMGEVIRVYEKWAEYINDLYLDIVNATTVCTLSAVPKYLSFYFKNVLLMGIRGSLATADYLSGNLALTNDNHVATTLCSVMKTACYLGMQDNTSTSITDDAVNYVSADIDNSSEITAGIILVPAMGINARLTARTDISIFARFANEELILASEIDDELVSALDERTVKNVEVKIT